MRVAFDLSATKGHKTGIGIYTTALIDALRAYAPQVEILALDDAATITQRTDRRIRREQLTLARLAQTANADLLHLTGFGAPFRSRVPIVLTVMDLIGVLFSQNFPPAARFYWSRYLPYTLRGARQIITLSAHTKQDILKLTPVQASHIHVIPPGLDARFHLITDTALLDETRAHLSLPAHYFLFVSTLEPRKGIDTLIAAYGEIASLVAEDLLIVGKRGWYYENIFASVRAAGLSARVRFLDYLSDADLPVVYNLATAFVFPSRYEGFGLTPLEALASGTPVISSIASSLPEVVGDTAILISPDDISGFARAMLALAGDADRRADLRARGLQRAQNFSWERAALATVQVYAQALTRSPV